MSRFRPFVAALASLAGLAGALSAAPASAVPSPSPSSALTYSFTDCTGPLGTPSAFDAVKQPSGAAALRLTDGSATFVLMEAVDELSAAVLFETPGLRHSDLPTVSCDATHPTTGAQARVTGLLTTVQ